MRLTRSIAYSIVARTGLHRMSRILTAKRVKVLMYHGIVSDDEPVRCWWLLPRSAFIDQIAYLKKHFSIISIDQFCQALLEKTEPPRHSIVITFDDGYRNFLTHALPVLQEQNIPSTLYIPATPVRTGRHIWADELYFELYQAQEDTLNLADIGAGTGILDLRTEREASIEKLLNLLKELPVNIRRERISRIINRVRPSSGTSSSTPFSPLSPHELKLISREELVTIGSHAESHEPLTSLSPQQAADEIRRSRHYLEELTGNRVEHFCYPAGYQNNDITHSVSGAGYKTAVIDRNVPQRETDMFRIPRIAIGAFDNLDFFRCQVNGISELKNRLKGRLFSRSLQPSP